MNAKIWIPLSAATITGAVAAWAGYQLVTQRPAGPAVVPVQLEEVIVAARPIPAGTGLAPEDLALVRVEKGSMPAHAGITKADLIGRVATGPIAPGQPITHVLLAEDGQAAGLAATLPSGFRAITIQIDPHSGLDGFLHPESRVDIIAALGSGDDTAARAVAQNVRVLAVSGRLQGEQIQISGEQQASLSNKYNVTLMVTLEQAAAIELAFDSGMPRLVLRPGGDNEIYPFSGMTMAQLRGEQVDVFVGGSNWEPQVPVTIDPPVATVEPTTNPSDPTPPPGPVPTVKAPRTHVIEVIRAGVISRMEMPLRGAAHHPARTSDRAVVNNDAAPVSGQ